MTHAIDETTGRPAVMVAGSPAWHGLGVNVEEAQTSEDAIELAGLDWSVDQFPVFAQVPHETETAIEQWVKVPKRVANVRTDTNAVLGVVGEQYRVFQNSEAFTFFDALVGERLAMYETAGSLHGGKTIWIMAKLPSDFSVAGDDEVKPYVLLVNAHDGTKSLRMLPTSIRVVCANTLNLALSGMERSCVIPHYPSLESRIRDARQALQLFGGRLDEFKDRAEAMANHDMASAVKLEGYFQGLYPLEGTDRQNKRNRRIINQLRDNFENERNTIHGIRGSLWAAFNSVTEYVDHQRSTRGQDESERRDNRVASIFFGSGNEVKQKAWTSALDVLAV